VRLLIDTNRYTDLARGIAEVVGRLELADEVWLSLIVLGELRAGFAAGTRTAENEEALDRFLHRYDIKILSLDETTTTYFGLVYSTLRRQGKMIPTNDIWLAAQALQHDLVLDSRDQHFQYVPGLKLALTQA
jgi:tRNA(fMet)-specific endonuclease VapC